jgi:four helix bundle protein
MVSHYYDLEVYRRAYQIALDIHRFTTTFPKHDLFTLGNQMQRASKGICANIAEGFAKHHKSTSEFKRFLSMSLGSANEMQVWLNFCYDLNYLEKNIFDQWHNEYVEISKMLYTLEKNWKG